MSKRRFTDDEHTSYVIWRDGKRIVVPSTEAVEKEAKKDWRQQLKDSKEKTRENP